MASLTNTEKLILEELLQMGDGYVLDFSDRSFREFLLTSVQADISQSKYSYRSGSKANRLRAFWNTEPDAVVGKLLNDLLDYWKAKKLINGQEIQSNEQQLFNEGLNITGRLLGQKREKTTGGEVTDDQFLAKEFKDISIDKLCLDNMIIPVLNQRLEEIERCLSKGAPLAAIFLCGSSLEGILLGVAIKNPKKFNQSKCSPKDKDGKVLKFPEWTLNNFIEVAKEIGLLDEDVKKFSHALRDFRNYIHPYEQAHHQFAPTEHTAKICFQVLKAAVFQLSKNFPASK